MVSFKKFTEKLYTTVLDPFTTVVGDPIGTAEAVFTKKTFKQTQSEFLKRSKVAKTGSVLGTGLALVPSTAIIGRAVKTKSLGQLAGKVGKGVFVGKTKVGTIAKTGTALFGAGVVAKSTRVRRVVREAPGRALETGAKTGAFLDKPKKVRQKTIKDKGIIGTIKEFGVKGGLIAGASALAVGGGIAGAKAVGNLLDKEKDILPKEQPKRSLLPESPQAPKELQPTVTAKPIASGTITRKRRKRRVKEPIRVSQRVVVTNRNTQKVYKGVYC